MAADESLARVIAQQRLHDAEWSPTFQPPAAPEGSPFVCLLRELNSLHDAKAADYSDEYGDNLRAARELGISGYLGVLLRMNDKMMRLKVIARTGKTHVVEESVVDTLKDIAVYALLAIILHREEVVAQHKG